MTSPAGSVSLHLQNETGNCAQCGSASRVGRGLCLKCLLSSGINGNGNGEHSAIEPTLDDLLSEIHGHDADWLLGNYQILEEIGLKETDWDADGRPRYRIDDQGSDP